MLDVRLFETAAGRRPVQAFLDELPGRYRALVMGDVALVALHGRNAPVSVKAIKGPQNRGLREIRTGGYRTLYCVEGGIMWLSTAARSRTRMRASKWRVSAGSG